MIGLGCKAVLRFDYRGLPGSPVPREWKARLNMIDWGTRDFPDAVASLNAVADGHDMVGIGHPYGGQALGISGVSERFSKYSAAATLSGYWRNTAEPWSVLLKMNSIGIPVAMALGKIPAWLGIGEPMPETVFRDWARWFRSPNYFFGGATLNMKSRFAEVKTLILSLGSHDDVLARRERMRL
jgi:predicted alpha/beta hydrolase